MGLKLSFNTKPHPSRFSTTERGMLIRHMARLGFGQRCLDKYI